jgi:hypothetical protein
MEYRKLSDYVTKLQAEGWMPFGPPTLTPAPQTNLAILNQTLVRTGPNFDYRTASNDVMFWTEKDLAALADGKHHLTFRGPDGTSSPLALCLWGGRRQVLSAEFDCYPWMIRRESSDRLRDEYFEYWRQVRKQNPSRQIRYSRTPGGNSLLSIDFLRSDSGLWLRRGAEFISDSANLIPDPLVRRFQISSL